MGKKSRNRRSKRPKFVLKEEDEPSPGGLTEILAHLEKRAEKENFPLEHYFRCHFHSISSCTASIGGYSILSFFAIESHSLSPGATERSFFTQCDIQFCGSVRGTSIVEANFPKQRDFRDGVFDVGVDDTPKEHFQAFVDHEQHETGLWYRRAPYHVCAHLLSECLVRMKTSKKTLNGKKMRTVVRLFGMESSEPFNQRKYAMPVPAPAPSVNILWLLLKRPEYHYFGFIHELMEHVFGFMPCTLAITHSYLEKGLNYISKDSFRRNRLIEMLGHMAMWHMLVGDNFDRLFSSWLLWEQRSMTATSVESPAAIDATKNNIISQLLVNNFFDGKYKDLTMPVQKCPNEYFQTIWNFSFHVKHMQITRKLPPAFIVTANIADDAKLSTICNRNQDLKADNSICQTIKSLKISKSACAVCGATRSTDGGRLKTCAKCDLVCYCSTEHQVFHWKYGGHRQECSCTFLCPCCKEKKKRQWAKGWQSEESSV